MRPKFFGESTSLTVARRDKKGGGSTIQFLVDTRYKRFSRTYSMNPDCGYLATCYHYIRPPLREDRFPRLLGNRIDVFHDHIRMLSSEFEIISPQRARQFSYGDFSPSRGRYGVLITFDDGLSDHYRAATVLAEYGIQSLFFVPTCSLIDGLPANPIIIHYGIAHFGLARFLDEYRNSLEVAELPVDDYDIRYRRGEDDPWLVISRIKKMFKYRMAHAPARRVLLNIYHELLLPEFEDALEILHLTDEQIREMLDMGHSIGVHSHSHLSVAAAELTREELDRELLEPRRYFERTFDISVNSLSYPFGGKQDCLTAERLVRQTNEFELAFTVENIVNRKNTSPFELGRYMPMSTDSAADLRNVLQGMISSRSSTQ